MVICKESLSQFYGMEVYNVYSDIMQVKKCLNKNSFIPFHLPLYIHFQNLLCILYSFCLNLLEKIMILILIQHYKVLCISIICFQLMKIIEREKSVCIVVCIKKKKERVFHKIYVLLQIYVLVALILYLQIHVILIHTNTVQNVMIFIISYTSSILKRMKYNHLVLILIINVH